MMEHEALNLAQRIASRWRGTPPATDWQTALEPLPHQPALAAFSYYAQTALDPGPTIRQFCDRAGMDIPPAHTAPVARLTREQRLKLLLTAGASPRMVSKSYRGHDEDEVARVWNRFPANDEEAQ